MGICRRADLSRLRFVALHLGSERARASSTYAKAAIMGYAKAKLSKGKSLEQVRRSGFQSSFVGQVRSRLFRFLSILPG